MAEHLPRGSEPRSEPPRRFLALIQDPDGYDPPGSPLPLPPPQGPIQPMLFHVVKADEHEEAMADAEALARVVSASLTHGEKSPLEAALTVYLSKHPWSDL